MSGGRDLMTARIARRYGCPRCVFYHHRGTEGSTVGDCRVGPPRTSTVRFPAVDRHDFCGEWLPANDALLFAPEAEPPPLYSPSFDKEATDDGGYGKTRGTPADPERYPPPYTDEEMLRTGREAEGVHPLDRLPTYPGRTPHDAP